MELKFILAHRGAKLYLSDIKINSKRGLSSFRKISPAPLRCMAKAQTLYYLEIISSALKWDFHWHRISNPAGWGSHDLCCVQRHSDSLVNLVRWWLQKQQNILIVLKTLRGCLGNIQETERIKVQTNESWIIHSLLPTYDLLEGRGMDDVPKTTFCSFII